MEERGPPDSDGNHDNHLSILQPERTHPVLSPQTSSKNDNSSRQPEKPVKSSNNDNLPKTPEHMAFQPGTYVVQVPKDQIYRIPPPEHAAMAEHQRSPPDSQKTLCCPCMYVCITFVIIFVVIIIVGGGVSALIMKHNNPKFHIQSLLLLDNQSDNDYDLSFQVHNPNYGTRIFYQQGGNASLFFKQQKIAVGTYPIFDQAPKTSTDSKMTLHGENKIAVPQELKESIEITNSSKLGVALYLSIDVPIRLKLGALKSGSSISVACNLKVDTLANDSRVVFQSCRTTKK